MKKVILSTAILLASIAAQAGVGQIGSGTIGTQSLSIACFNDQTNIETARLSIWQNLLLSDDEKIAINVFVETYPISMNVTNRSIKQEMIAYVSPKEYRQLLKQQTGTLVLKNYQSRESSAGTIDGFLLVLNNGRAQLAAKGDVYWFGCN